MCPPQWEKRNLGQPLPPEGGGRVVTRKGKVKKELAGQDMSQALKNNPIRMYPKNQGTYVMGVHRSQTGKRLRMRQEGEPKTPVFFGKQKSPRLELSRLEIPRGKKEGRKRTGKKGGIGHSGRI